MLPIGQTCLVSDTWCFHAEIISPKPRSVDASVIDHCFSSLRLATQEDGFVRMARNTSVDELCLSANPCFHFRQF
jgi:hypothetical protein